MRRPARLVLLALANCLFWAVMFGLTWFALIPEPLMAAEVFACFLFGVPAAGCCGFWLLLYAQLHETGWRLWLAAGIVVVNSAAWACCVDWLWLQVTGRSKGRGFAVRGTDRDESAPN